jgi:hypothetical protein
MHATSALRAPGLAVVLALSTAAPAIAGVFDVKTPEAAKGETEIGVNTTFFSGYPMNADLLRRSAEVGVGYGFADWWKAGLKLSLDQPVGGNLEVQTAGVEGLWVLRKREGNALGIAWFTGADFRIADAATNTLTFGPIIQWGTDKTTLTLNPLFARTFGRNREEGVDFTYAWQVKHEVREGFSIGVEGYGVLPNIGKTPGIDFQEHRIGPVLYFERSLARGATAAPKMAGMKDVKGAADAGKDGDGGPKFAGEIGVLFGLTDATQDVAIKIKGAITF